MKKINFLVLLLALAMPKLSIAYKYEYLTAENDPMHTMIYTLPNGLKVYMSVNKDKPRIQTNIAVRVGSKNDPPETTGLAHYFEHMMFKGTDKFGTSDYQKEKPMLDEIENLFEIYRVTTDSLQRAQIYHKIDSISYQASLIAIPNEYDKLMASIGANGTNAYTSYDMTCYVEDIPSNEIERWAQVQANRFECPVLRGFHTELETIYEEKNMSLTDDMEKAIDAMFAGLFPDHPYGQWDVLGHQTHLKNPSLKNIKNYHKQWYVPNNMAILMAGDFDPDNAVDIITKYFGHLQPNLNLPVLSPVVDPEITKPLRKDVYGQEAEFIILAWPMPKASDPSIEIADILDAMLTNGKAGLIDVDVNQKQLAQEMSSGLYTLADRSVYLIMGTPKEGQTLEQLENLILRELRKLHSGDFDESLISASINNYKLNKQRALESNNQRVNMMSDMFINGIDLDSYVGTLDRQAKLTKQDLVDFATKNIREDNYMAVYKRQGKDDSQLKIAKQPITPLAVNRDNSSAFLQEILTQEPNPIEPVFLDFDKDLEYLTVNGNLPVLYKKNDTNDTFQLTYIWDFGSNNDPKLSLLAKYFPLLGTEEMTVEEIKKKFYDIACSYYLSVNGTRCYVVISGLSENMPKAIQLVDDLMTKPKAEQETYCKVAESILKDRIDNKADQSANFSALCKYMYYGKDQLAQMTLTNDEITSQSALELTQLLSSLNNIEHKIIYYGPLSQTDFTSIVEEHHNTPRTLASAPERKFYQEIIPQETTFFIAPYDAKQIYMLEYSNTGKKYDANIENLRKIYNEYFGGGMNSIVFQEMREARSLAYSAWAYMYQPSFLAKPYTFEAQIATQNDKMEDAISGFEQIIENMPVSQDAFDLAIKGMELRLRSDRIIKDNIAWTLLGNAQLGIKGDERANLYDSLSKISLSDIEQFQKDHVKGRTYYYAILGDPNDLDLDALRRRGKVVMLTTDEIFGY